MGRWPLLLRGGQRFFFWSGRETHAALLPESRARDTHTVRSDIASMYPLLLSRMGNNAKLAASSY